MRKLLQDEDFLVYSRPMLAVVMIKRSFRALTRRTRKVNMEFDWGLQPPPERQHIDTHKWAYFITLNFNRPLPPIGWDQAKDFNSFLLMTEGDRLLIGVHFVTIFTDEPWKYNNQNRVAEMACKAFGLELNQLTDVTV